MISSVPQTRLDILDANPAELLDHKRLSKLWTRLGRGLERIEHRHLTSIEGLDVAGDDDQAIHTRGRGRAGIIDMLVALTQRFAPGCCNGSVDRQYSPLESIEYR